MLLEKNEVVVAGGSLAVAQLKHAAVARLRRSESFYG